MVIGTQHTGGGNPAAGKGTKMTRAQEIAIDRIKHIVKEDFLYSDNFEIKEWKVTENEYFVSLVVTTGLKNDEGTAASVLCRNTAHLFIGKRGGVRYPVVRNGKIIERRFNVWHQTLLTVVLDQNKDFYKG